MLVIIKAPVYTQIILYMYQKIIFIINHNASKKNTKIMYKFVIKTSIISFMSSVTEFANIRAAKSSIKVLNQPTIELRRENNMVLIIYIWF